MKRAIVLAVTIAAGMTPAFAALAPEYQRVAEFRAVISEATRVLGTIDGVTFVSDDVYEARSASCRVIVRIEDVASQAGGKPVDGPRQFRAFANPPACD